jgi:hypothetical protein
MHLTPVYAVWKWGEPAPPPENGEQTFVREQRKVYQQIHGHIFDVHQLQMSLSGEMDKMAEDLEEP